MTIQDWGAVGEIVGAIAIVVTLVYLANQMRHARLASSDASRQHRVAAIRDIEHFLLDHPEIGGAWRKATGAEFRDLDETLATKLGLTVDEAASVRQIGTNWLWTHWAQYRSHKTKEDDAELRQIVGVFYASPPMSVLIEQPLIRAAIDAEFLTWIDSVIAGKPSA
jgi:hypothetical protein